MTVFVTKRYSPLAKVLHWGFILLFAYGIFKQVDDISQLEDKAFLRFEVLFALAFLLISLATAIGSLRRRAKTDEFSERGSI